MPKQFHPRQRTVHRVACIALYRALLTKCPKISVPPHLQRGRIHPIAEIVQKQFRRNAQYESPTLVVAALKVGYEAEELLHNATIGSQEAHTKILSLLSAYQQQSNLTRAQHALSPPPPPLTHIRPARAPGTPLAISIHPRPSSCISGAIRKIPKLVSANSFPFLRYHKKQSGYLSRVLGDKIRVKVRRYTVMEEMRMEGGEGGVAGMEEEWDGLVDGTRTGTGREEEVQGWDMDIDMKWTVKKAKGKGKGKERGFQDEGFVVGGWREEFLRAERVASDSLNLERKRTQVMGEKMTQILMKERRLAGEENALVEREKARDIRKRRRHRKTEEDRRMRNKLLDSLDPAEREVELARFRKALQEKKALDEKAKSEAKSQTPNRYKEERPQLTSMGQPSPAQLQTSTLHNKTASATYSQPSVVDEQYNSSRQPTTPQKQKKAKSISKSQAEKTPDGKRTDRETADGENTSTGFTIRRQMPPQRTKKGRW